MISSKSSTNTVIFMRIGDTHVNVVEIPWKYPSQRSKISDEIGLGFEIIALKDR